MNSRSHPHLLGLLAGLFLAAGLVLSAMVVTRAWLKVAESQTISVTGAARKNIRADFIVWRSSFSTEAPTLLAAQRALKTDLGRVDAWLKDEGITNHLVSPISIQEVRATEKAQGEAPQQRTVSYRLSQLVEIRSPEVDRVLALERESVGLVEQGVLFSSNPPEFISTKAGEAKVEMLAEATKEARARADQIAAQGNRMIAQLRSAKMGVFQITPIYSLQTSWDGINDTTSLEKTITAVVTATFSLR
jgi:hypothetical protein